MIDRILARLTINAAIIALLVGALVAQTVRIEGFKFWPLSIPGLKAQLSSERDGRKADREAYERAQKDAAQQNKAEVARIEGKYAANNEKAKNDYQTDLARVRAEFERLHRKAAPGASGSAGSPAPPNAPGGIDGAAVVPVPAELLLYGAEIELRLLHLQRLVRKQVEER